MDGPANKVVTVELPELLRLPHSLHEGVVAEEPPPDDVVRLLFVSAHVDLRATYQGGRRTIYTLRRYVDWQGLDAQVKMLAAAQCARR